MDGLPGVTRTRRSCALKTNTRYGSKDSTQTGPVLILCGSKIAQTCYIPWPSAADRYPEQSEWGTRDKHEAATQKLCALCSSIIVLRKKWIIIYGHACSVLRVKSIHVHILISWSLVLQWPKTTLSHFLHISHPALYLLTIFGLESSLCSHMWNEEIGRASCRERV